MFTDNHPGGGTNQYRLKMIYANGRIEYSNTVRLLNDLQKTYVYPNPAKDVVTISINGTSAADYDVVLISTGGQVIYNTILKNSVRTTVQFNRNGAPAGMYLLHIKNLSTGTSEYHKVIFR